MSGFWMSVTRHGKGMKTVDVIYGRTHKMLSFLPEQQTSYSNKRAECKVDNSGMQCVGIFYM